MSDETTSNIHVLYEAPEDSPEKQAVIETLLWALEEVRRDRICSVAVVGVSDDFSRTMLFSEGVRMDQTPHVCGMLSMLAQGLIQTYDEAIEGFHIESDIDDS